MQIRHLLLKVLLSFRELKFGCLCCREVKATSMKENVGSFQSLSFPWGFCLMVSVHKSGSDVNPATTISLAIIHKFLRE